jgi:hypothetical protein
VVDAVGGDVSGGEHGFGVLDQAVRAAEPPVVDVGGGHDGIEEGGEAVGVEAAGEEVDVTGLAGQHVDELEAGAVAVFEVGQVFGEHHGVGAAVAVQERHLALRVGGQDGADDRDHRGDAGAGGDEAVVRRPVEGGGELSQGGQHFQGVAGFEGVDELGGEEAAFDAPDTDPRRGAGGCADRVRPAFLGAFDVLAQGEVLTGLEREVLGEVVGHVEGHRDGVTAQTIHFGHTEPVEGGAGH